MAMMRLRASSTSSQAVQATSRSQPADTSSPEQVHASFQYAQAALSSVAPASATAPSSTEVPIGVQMDGVAGYAQANQQQAGQVLDISA